MANAIGGIVIIGIEEDDQARASKYSPVDISDAERLRLASTLLGNVQPMLTFDIHPIEDPQRPGQGFLVIWVARDAGSPPAYCQGTARHYPRRADTQKQWLSEAEIAEAYRARFAGLANRIRRLGFESLRVHFFDGGVRRSSHYRNAGRRCRSGSPPALSGPRPGR
jgi:predicted HTH transcriptional regulator